MLAKRGSSSPCRGNANCWNGTAARSSASTRPITSAGPTAGPCRWRCTRRTCRRRGNGPPITRRWALRTSARRSGVSTGQRFAIPIRRRPAAPGERLAECPRDRRWGANRLLRYRLVRRHKFARRVDRELWPWKAHQERPDAGIDRQGQVSPTIQAGRPRTVNMALILRHRPAACIRLPRESPRSRPGGFQSVDR